MRTLEVCFPGNRIHHTAVIYPGVKIGTGNEIGPYCIIGAPAEHKKYWGKVSKGVVIGDNNIFTGACTVDAGTENDTTIGNGCFIMKRAHIGHDALLGNDVIVTVNAVVGGHVIVMDGANLGMNVCTHQFSIIGAYSMLGMGSVVPLRKEVRPFFVYTGNPIKVLRTNDIKVKEFTKQEFVEYFNQYDKLLKNRK